MHKSKILALTLCSMVALSGCGKGDASKGPEKVISDGDRAILEDAVIDIDEVARLCELPKPDIASIEKRCQEGKEKSDKLEDKDKEKLMDESYDYLLKYVKDKGNKDAYQNFIKALQNKEQLN